MCLTKQVIVVRKDLKMKVGKLAAQVAHASRAFLSRQLKSGRPSTHFNGFEYTVCLDLPEQQWIEADHETTIVLGCDSLDDYHAIALAAEQAGLRVNKIQDIGKTVFHGVPTYTTLAIGPSDAERIDAVTGHLELL